MGKTLLMLEVAERAVQPRSARVSIISLREVERGGSATGVKLLPMNAVRCACPHCRKIYSAPPNFIGAAGRCPHCKAKLAIRRMEDFPTTVEAKEPSANAATRLTPTQIRRKLAILHLRQRSRVFCDALGLGPSAGERFCCVLIVAVVPFALSFIVALLTHEPAGYAALQGLAAFALAALFGMLLVGRQSDADLVTRRDGLICELPLAQEREEAARQTRLDSAAKSDRRRAEAPPEAPEPRRTEPQRNNGRSVVRITQVIHSERRSEKSAGLAAVLEILCGLFLCTFGIGHFYAGAVGMGLFLLLGWWGFLFVNAVLGLVSCGTWFYLAVVIVPVCWFILLVLSPVLAASEASSC